MRVCIDTTILLDILKDEFRDFQENLYAALERKDDLLAPSVVYAELIPQFAGDTKLLQEFLGDHKITIEPLDVDSVTTAARAWMKYLKRKTRARCPECNHKLNQKKRLLSDFYIGGFAISKTDAILTRDRGIYKKYFPDLVGYQDCLRKTFS